MKYLEHLASQAGVQGANAVVDGDCWTRDDAERDGRPLPSLAVEWVVDWKAWIASVGTLASSEFAHPSDAFSWLRNAVAEYEWPVCVHCNDTGEVSYSRDCATAEGSHYTVDESEFCDCHFGNLAAAKEAVDRR